MGHAGQVQSTHASAHTGLCPRVASQRPASTQESCRLLAVLLAACVRCGWNKLQVLPFHLACS